MSAWSGVAEAYRVSFGTLCAGPVDRLLADALDGPLLDVGCGTGGLAASAASAGHPVVAVDADPDMTVVAAASLPGRVVGAALPRLPFPDDAFATTTANFVVNHVPDPRAAVAELARVTRRGGRVAMTSWTSAPAAWAGLVGDAFASAGAVAPPAQRLAPELDFERSPEGLAGLAAGAGLQPLTVTELRWTWEVPAADLWAGVTGGVAGPGRTFLAQSREVQEAATAAFHADRPADRAPLRLAAVAAYVLAEG
ncbi:hypothetical protein GCM10009623_13620 [Nocardioides aestuarii]|uniref:Class I SAM-dependent methyltransferase n=1 Tax=Nocardioides aestuarii TaxID=252231 RepID=A0ABW4TIN9_9ACTN